MANSREMETGRSGGQSLSRPHCKGTEIVRMRALDKNQTEQSLERRFGFTQLRLLPPLRCPSSPPISSGSAIIAITYKCHTDDIVYGLDAYVLPEKRRELHMVTTGNCAMRTSCVEVDQMS